jgi:hypothetical protein
MPGGMPPFDRRSGGRGVLMQLMPRWLWPPCSVQSLSWDLQPQPITGSPSMSSRRRLHADRCPVSCRNDVGYARQQYRARSSPSRRPSRYSAVIAPSALPCGLPRRPYLWPVERPHARPASALQRGSGLTFSYKIPKERKLGQAWPRAESPLAGPAPTDALLPSAGGLAAAAA